MKIFMVQKQTNTIASCHYDNVNPFSTFEKAFKYINSLKLVPLNFLDTTQFLGETVKEFGEVKYLGLKNEQREVSNRYRIVTMDVL